MAYSSNQRLALLLWLGVALWCSAGVALADFRIINGGSNLAQHTLSTSAMCKIELGPAAEALQNGIDIQILIELRLRKVRSLLWDKELARWRYPYTLSYHALSGRYVVHSPAGERLRTYATLSDALARIGDFKQQIALAPAIGLNRAHQYRVAMRIKLNEEFLPLPLKLVARISPAWWNLTSNWQGWRLIIS